MDYLLARKECLAKKAQEAGFTEQGINAMLLLLNLDEGAIKDMTIVAFQDLLLYVNDLNAKTFNRW